ncbi:hypothetical protein GCM10023310_70400 [Paenibacillus vulneris]
MAGTSVLCERCGHSFHQYEDGDDVCEVCLSELKEDELYEAYIASCVENGLQPLIFDEWIIQLADVEVIE